MKYEFPDTSGLERAKSDPTEFIYPTGSIGSNRIFHTLRTTAGNANSPRWNFFLINIYTLVRNAYRPNISLKEIEQILDQDVDLYMTFIAAYLNHKHPYPGIVVFYAPNYRIIPALIQRVHIGHRLELDALYQKIYMRLPTRLSEMTEDPMLRKFIYVCNGSQFPHKELRGVLSEIYRMDKAAASDGVLMISHCPIDYHLVHSVPNINLMESFTGVVLIESDFGRKLNKEVLLPFNTVTHRVFGDEVHLAAMVRAKNKKKMVELAENNRWYLKTEREIVANITQNFPDINERELYLLRL